MATEYFCCALIEGEPFEFETLAAVTIDQAKAQFTQYIMETSDKLLSIAEWCSYERIDAVTGEPLIKKPTFGGFDPSEIKENYVTQRTLFAQTHSSLGRGRALQ